MSYCVHCGVKLGVDAAVCPLCGTPVNDPLAEKSIPEALWPEREDHFQKHALNWPYLSCLVLLGLAVSSCAVMLCDLITTGHISWSWYVVGAALSLGGFAAIPNLHHSWSRSVCAYTGIELMLLIIAWRNDGFRWYCFLALPFSSIITAYLLICLRLVLRKKLRLLHRIALCLTCLVLSLIAVEALTDQYVCNEIHLFWSVYAVIPLAVIAILFMLLSRNKHLVETIRKNTFI